MDNQNNNNSDNQVTDMRSIEPEVIGHLRKEKIGDPSKALLLGVLLITVLISLPFVTELLQEDPTINQIVPGNATQPVSQYAKGDINQPLSSTLVMKYENIVMRNFRITGNSVECKINSYNGILDLDKVNYYLVISSKQGNDIGYLKLTGTYDYQETEVTLSSTKLNFNNTLSYFGRIVELKEEDYPEFSLTPDSMGNELLTCKKDNRTLTYNFKENKLININDEEIVKTKDFKTIDLYVTEKGKYEEKCGKVGINAATVEEGQDGFAYRANMDLNNINISVIKDDNYFEKNTDAKVVDFVLESKGFDCK